MQLRAKFFFLAATVLASFQQAQAQRVPDNVAPTFTITAPVAGTTINTGEVVFSGEARDTAQTPGTGQTVTTAGVAKVQYRLSGSRKWHNAALSVPGGATTTYFFTLKLPAGTSKTVYIRVLDRTGNESDTVGRIVKRSQVTRRFQ